MNWNYSGRLTAQERAVLEYFRRWQAQAWWRS